jgi:hypothetical protein
MKPIRKGKIMKRTFAFLAFAVLTSGVVAAQERGTVMITPTDSVAADKMKLDAESLLRMQEPQGTFMYGGPVKGAPFTAQQISESSGALRDGTHISRSTTVAFARDAEGRTRRETDNMITIMDPVASVSYSLNKKNHTAIKMDLKTSVMLNGATIVLDGNSSTMRDDLKDKIAAEIKMKVISDDGVNKGVVQRTPSTERNEESLGAQTMEGLVAVGKRTTITVPVNPEIGNDQPIKVVDEQWYSPDLQINIVSSTDDPRRTTQTTERYTNIKRGEPDPSLFQIPADFTVVTKKAQQ